MRGGATKQVQQQQHGARKGGNQYLGGDWKGRIMRGEKIREREWERGRGRIPVLDI